MKHTDTILECDIKFFCACTIALIHHMNKLIFTYFRVFWMYFSGKMHYMSMLESIISTLKLVYWEISRHTQVYLK